MQYLLLISEPIKSLRTESFINQRYHHVQKLY